MSTATNIVTHQVLFSRRNNENATSAGDPVRTFVPGQDDALLLRKSTFCFSSDDDRLVEGASYVVCAVRLPEFLSVEEWASNLVRWKHLWGQGVDPKAPEAWQRGLLYGFSGAEQAACAKLLNTKKFRSAFRQSLRDRLVEWLETAPDARQYKTPFSNRQWECVVDKYIAREASAMAEALYRSNRCVENHGCPVSA